MTDDWKPGDLALCVKRNEAWPEAVVPGRVFTVEAVWHGIPDRTKGYEGQAGTCLDLQGQPRFWDNCAYGVRNFRKIKPHAPDAEDAETIRLLNSKPAKVPA